MILEVGIHDVFPCCNHCSMDRASAFGYKASFHLQRNPGNEFKNHLDEEAPHFTIAYGIFGNRSLASKPAYPISALTKSAAAVCK